MKHTYSLLKFIMVVNIFILSTNVIWAQTLPNVIPPTPQSQLFEKYLNYEVCLYNGVPEISIPLYEIQIKGMTIPVSLSYHGSGIKYAQYDGDVAAGWVLNPGYRITRTVLGKADERTTMPEDCKAYLDTSHNWKRQQEYLLSFISDQGGYPGYLYPYKSGLDGQQDIFTYMLPSINGHFFIKDRTNKTIEPVEWQNNIQVSYSIESAPKEIEKIAIIDDKGFSYHAGKDIVSSKIAKEYNAGYNIPTAWLLTDLIAPNGEHVNFRYTGKTIKDGYYYTINITEPHPNVRSDFEVSQLEVIQEQCLECNNTNVSLLEEITTEDQRVKIIRNENDKVSQIEIFSGTKLIKKFRFYYSQSERHTLLDSLVQEGENLEKKVYSFFYYPSIPFLNSVPDQWGYYKSSGKQGDHGFHKEFDDNYYIANTGASAEQSFQSRTGATNFRGVVQDDPVYFSLKRITYPTGGYTEYEYESNQYEETGKKIKGGGLRIKKISSCDGINANILSHTYKYGQNDDGAGIPNVYMNKNFFAKESLLLYYGGTGQYPSYHFPKVITRRQFQVSTNPIGYLNAFGESYVKYNRITEFTGDTSNRVTPEKTIYSYQLGNEFVVGNQSPSRIVSRTFYNKAISTYNLWQKPLLNKKEHFVFRNNQYKPLVTEENKYSMASRSYAGINVNVYAWLKDQWIIDYIGSAPLFDYSFPRITSGINLLEKKMVTNYTEKGDSVRNTTDYTYNNLHYPDQEKRTSSNGDTLTVIYKYPSDFSDVPVYDEMVKENIISPVIASTSFKNDSIQTKKIRTNYFSPHKGIYVPEFVEEQNLNSPSEKRIQFNKYDTKGNILEQQKVDDIKEVYLWGYNGQYPVAKITGSDLSIVLSVIDTTRLRTPANDETLRDVLSPLRNISHALVSTYTYAPLIGMTSETDPNGKITYYEFDSFGRLSIVRDHDKKIVRKICYNYAGQPEDCSKAIYYNEEQTQSFTRNDCTTGGTPGNVEYAVPAGKYTSGISLADANAQAWAEINANGQSYANVNAVCTYVNTEQSQSFTRNDCTVGGTGGPVIYSVPAGKYSSTISLDDANAQAWTEINANGQNHANANAVCTYPNTEQSQTFTRNDCTTGGTPGSVAYTVPAGKYTSNVSLDDANTQAWAEINANGQNHANANAVCTYVNDAQSQTFARNDCTTGGTPGSVAYTVPPGKYTSTISLEDANAHAWAEINTYGQSHVNANAVCTYVNEAQSQSFTRNDCTAGGVGGSVTYSVPAGKYTSNISLDDANTQAWTEINTYGQSHANANTVCTYYNEQQLQYFIRNNCITGPSGNVEYSVAAGKYTSSISLEDANAQALAEIAANGQVFANTNGACKEKIPVYLRLEKENEQLAKVYNNYNEASEYYKGYLSGYENAKNGYFDQYEGYYNSKYKYDYASIPEKLSYDNCYREYLNTGQHSYGCIDVRFEDYFERYPNTNTFNSQSLLDGYYDGFHNGIADRYENSSRNQYYNVSTTTADMYLHSYADPGCTIPVNLPYTIKVNMGTTKYSCSNVSGQQVTQLHEQNQGEYQFPEGSNKLYIGRLDYNNLRLHGSGNTVFEGDYSLFQILPAENELYTANPSEPVYFGKVWGNTEVKQAFTKNDCPAGSFGNSIEYAVLAGKHTSYINQAAANALAMADIAANGQTWANANTTCKTGFVNDDQSGNYYSNICGIDLNTELPMGNPYYISVPAGMFNSEISKEDANKKAKTYAQQMADNNGSCQGSNYCQLILDFPDHPNYYPHKFDVTIQDNNTGTYIKFPMTEFGTAFSNKLMALIPEGCYTVYIESKLDYYGSEDIGYPFNFDLNGNTMYGEFVYFDGLCFYGGDIVYLSVN